MAWVLRLVAVDVAVLIVWTVMDRPRVVVDAVVVDDVGERPERPKNVIMASRPTHRTCYAIFFYCWVNT